MRQAKQQKPDGVGNRQAIRIVLRHHNDPDGKYLPQSARCETDTEKHRVGCGAGIVFYRTYPNDKRMPFDGAPDVVPNTEATLGDGAVVAWVFTENTHFATCPVRKQAAERDRQERANPAYDGRERGAGRQD